jgi:2-methylcitrate dehydratase PrpD
MSAGEQARPDVTRQLAALVGDHPRGSTSPKASNEVGRALLDLIGVTILGSAEPAGQLAINYVLSQAASGPSAVIGTSHRLSPTLAALANGTSGHALDYDDIGLGAGHVSVAIVPAALAIADQLGSTGAEFIDAMVVGYEIAHRLTLLHEDNISGPYEYGYHKPSVYAVFGATAAVCRLLKMSTRQVQEAFGIAASQSGGVRINFGTMTKPLHAGLSNRTGVEAGLLVESGFTASPEALEGLYGWFDTICRREGDLTRLVAPLGDHFAVEEGMTFKGFPCCGANHYAIDGVLLLMSEYKVDPEEVELVDVTINAKHLDEVLVYPWPSSGLEGKFSLTYNVAAAIADGQVTVSTFSDDQIPRLLTVKDRIAVHSKANMPRNGAYIRIRTKDGTEYTRDHKILRGTIEDPFTWDELAAKLRSNVAGHIAESRSIELIERIAHLEEADDMNAITDLLVSK